MSAPFIHALNPAHTHLTAQTTPVSRDWFCGWKRKTQHVPCHWSSSYYTAFTSYNNVSKYTEYTTQNDM